MYLWYIVFADDPERRVLHDQWEAWPGRLAEFRQVCAAGVLKGRYVLGMWVVHESPAGFGILERFGHMPTSLTTRGTLPGAPPGPATGRKKPFGTD